MERLVLHELHPVQSSGLVSVGVLLGSPEGPVPVLSVGAVASRKLVTLQGRELQLVRVLEVHAGVATAPVVAGLGCRLEEAVSERGGAVVLGVAV